MGTYQKYPEYIDSGLAWLGDMPSHWQLRKSKYLFNRMQRPVRPEDGVVTAFRDGQVTLRTKRRTDGFTQSVKEIGYQSVRVGDLLVHAMDGFAGAIGVSDSDGKCSPVCSVCVPVNSDQIHMPYYGYLVRQLAVTDFISSLAKGIRERSTEFRYSEFSALDLAVPSLGEQEKIANFLDHETAKIDTLIEKQQQLIKLLKEKRQAVISHAVTKGLNPNAPMRDSGVEWLGEVPEHWERKSLNYLIAHTVDNRGRTPPVIDSGIPMAEVSQVAGNGFYTSDNYSKFITQESYDQFVRSDVKENDILFVTVGATFGKTCLVPPSPEFFIAQNVVGFRCVESVDPKFFMFLLSSSVFKEAISATNKSSTIDNVKVSDLVKTRLVIPPDEEQVEISNHIFTIVDQYEKLVSKAESVIGLMQERRTALISAAVTGKIDVRYINSEDGQPQKSSNTNNKEVAA